MPRSVLTDVAERKITGAAGTGQSVAISHVALGDGNGAAYSASFAQTTLRRERARVAITNRHRLSTTSWRIAASFGAEIDTFYVREIGFFDADGDLITVTTFDDEEVRQAGAVEYLVDHVLDFGRVEEGLVIVDAPDDQVFAMGLTMLAEMASSRLAQFTLTEAFYAKHGHYPGEVQ